MRDWLRMKWAHIQDAVAIWDGSPRPCESIWLRVKASICIALNREEKRNIFSDVPMVPVWASSPVTYWGYSGPGQNWREIAVSLGIWNWKFCQYENGF